MWLITYEVIPKPNTPAFNECGGAYVSCWILFAWQDGAEHLARYEVEKEWLIVQTEEISWVESDDIAIDSENRQYFEQALVDGGTFAYFQFPIEAESEDEDFEIENSSVSSDRKLKTSH